MNEYISVSIICNTYNHEKYIRDALDSFLMQKTDFVFEVLIHDDASTDKTAEIIREYEERYPDIVKPIYQTENQYSKGVKIGFTYQYPRVKGKYIAFCEGDDYWTDPYKLQKQYEALEEHPEVDICAHGAYMVSAETKERLKDIAPATQDKVLPIDEVIMGEGGYVATNSLMYRKELNDDMPEFRRFLSLDYALQIHGALRGGMLYLKDTMSAYRWMTTSSWTRNMSQASHEKRQAFFEKKQKMLQILDEQTNFSYTTTIQKRMKKNYFGHFISLGEYKQALSKEYRDVFKELPFKERWKILLKAYFPFLVTLKRKLTRKNH